MSPDQRPRTTILVWQLFSNPLLSYTMSVTPWSKRRKLLDFEHGFKSACFLFFLCLFTPHGFCPPGEVSSGGGGLPRERVLHQSFEFSGMVGWQNQMTVAVVKPWEDTQSNKSLGCLFSEKPADWTNAFKLEISGLIKKLWRASLWSFESRMTPRFLAELKKGMLWEPRVIESGRETVEGFKEDERGKRRASVLLSFSLNWFSVIHVFMSSVHALSSLVRLVTSLRGADFRSCGSSEKKLMIYRVVTYDIREECSAQDKKKGPQHWTLRHTIHGWDGDENELLTEVDWYLSERYDWNHWSAADWMPKTVQAGEENLVVNSIKAAERSDKRKNPERREYCLQYNIYNAIWLLHGRCHVKKSFCLGAFSAHRTTIHHATSLHAKPHIRRAHACIAVTCLLHRWQNDRGLLRATAVTRWPRRKHFTCCTCQDSNPGPFDHETGAVTTELSPHPANDHCKQCDGTSTWDVH